MSLNNRCDSFRFDNGVPCCLGTKERETCNCNGDKTLCDFYPEIREKAIAQYEKEDTTKILKDFGVLDQEGHLSEVYRNIYELRKRQLTGAHHTTKWTPAILPMELNGETFHVTHYQCEYCKFAVPTNRITPEDYKYCPKCGSEITYV